MVGFACQADPGRSWLWNGGMGRKHKPAGLGSQSSRRPAPSSTPADEFTTSGPDSPLPGFEIGAASNAEGSPPNDWLRLAFEMSRDAAFVFDRHWRLLDCNLAARQILSRSKDELIARSFSDLSDTVTAVSHGKLRLTPRATGETWRLHAVEPREPQSAGWLASRDASAASSTTESAKLRGLAEQIALDAASRNTSFHDLSEVDPLVRNVLESLPVGVWVIDLDGDVVVANSMGREIWGGARNDWRRDGWWTATGAKIAQDQWPGPRVLATGDAVPPAEAEVVTFDQVRKTLLVSATPLRNEQGRLLGAVCIHQDITSRVNAERAAQCEVRRNVQLERLASIGTLAAGIAHEINNPLGTILLSAELSLASLSMESDEQRRALESIVVDAKRCGRIVHNLLRFASRSATDRSPGDLNSIVRGVHQRVMEQAAQRGVTFNVELTERLPPVIVDAAAMEQAITNIIRNAIEASAESDTARVEIQTEPFGAEIRLTVRDYGPGIKADDLPRLFDPFYTTRRNMGSVGLGLSVAHGIVRDHEGQLRIESTPNQGATIFLDLPIAFQAKAENDESTT